MAPKQTDPQFKLRMTPEIKEAIEQAAKENNRSMNAEILARLEESFSHKPSSSVVSLAPMMLNEDDAAAYLSLTRDLFLELVHKNVLPQPHFIFGSRVWVVNEIDKHIEKTLKNKMPPK